MNKETLIKKLIANTKQNGIYYKGTATTAIVKEAVETLNEVHHVLVELDDEDGPYITNLYDSPSERKGFIERNKGHIVEIYMTYNGTQYCIIAKEN